MMSAETVTTQDIEEDRLRLVNKMVADSGAAWAGGFRPGTSGCHELLDRTQLMADMLEQHLLNHPACVAEAEWYALADRAASALRELYQRIGAEHLAADDTVTSTPRAGSVSKSERLTQPATRTSVNPTVSGQTERSPVENKDVELVASWLHEAARSLGHVELVRSVMKRAADNAAEMYAAPGDHATMEDNDDTFGVRNVLGRLGSKWDELEREAKEDDAQD